MANVLIRKVLGPGQELIIYEEGGKIERKLIYDLDTIDKEKRVMPAKTITPSKIK